MHECHQHSADSVNTELRCFWHRCQHKNLEAGATQAAECYIIKAHC